MGIDAVLGVLLSNCFPPRTGFPASRVQISYGNHLSFGFILSIHYTYICIYIHSLVLLTAKRFALFSAEISRSRVLFVNVSRPSAALICSQVTFYLYFIPWYLVSLFPSSRRLCVPRAWRLFFSFSGLVGSHGEHEQRESSTESRRRCLPVTPRSGRCIILSPEVYAARNAPASTTVTIVSNRTWPAGDRFGDGIRTGPGVCSRFFHAMYVVAVGKLSPR